MIPSAFISISTKASALLLKTTIFTGSWRWRSVSSSPISIARPPSPDRVIDLPPGLGGLDADRLRQRVGHAAVDERADQPATAVHAQVARGPEGRRPDVGDEDRVVGGDLVERSRDDLGMERARSPWVAREPVEPSRAFDGSALSSVAGASSSRPGSSARSSAGDRVLHRADQRDVDRIRRPMCSPRTSTWITLASSG